MPKVTDAYRAARREEIALAALRAVTELGFANVRMSDVAKESGLSAGALYSNFTNKAELARFVARALIGDRVQKATEEAFAADTPLAPGELLVRVLTSLEERHVPFGVLLQLWAESTTDDDLRSVVVETATGLRAAMRRGIEPWVRQRHPDADTDALCDEVALTMTTLAQGYIARAALLGIHDPAGYIATAKIALAD